MNLLCSTVEKRADIVAQLCTTHYGIVAEHNALVFHDGTIGNEFHLCHKVATRLTARGKTAWPCGSVFQHSSLVGHVMTFCITKGKAHS